VTHNGRLTPDEMADGLILTGEEQLRYLCAICYDLFFHILDADRDGFIDSKQLSDFFEILGILDELLVAETFKVIDTDNDGLISKEEYLNATLEFMLSGVERPTTIFFGPLVD
jgi:hypothetical protein